VALVESKSRIKDGSRQTRQPSYRDAGSSCGRGNDGWMSVACVHACVRTCVLGLVGGMMYDACRSSCSSSFVQDKIVEEAGKDGRETGGGDAPNWRPVGLGCVSYVCVSLEEEG
jgi:hypothetical protein